MGMIPASPLSTPTTKKGTDPDEPATVDLASASGVNFFYNELADY